MSNQKFLGEIRQAAITNKQCLKIKFIQTTEDSGRLSNTELGGSRDRIVHNDLLLAFSVLKSHAMLIGEFVPKGSVIDGPYIKQRNIVHDPLYKNYDVIGFAIKGDEDKKVVILTVSKELMAGGVITFNLPPVRLYSDSEYEFSGNLSDDLEDAIVEVRRYMEGKYGDSNQLTLFVSEEDDNVFSFEQEDEDEEDSELEF